MKDVALALLVIAVFLGVFLGYTWAIATASVEFGWQEQKRQACQVVCDEHRVNVPSNFHSADKNLCVCNDGKTYKYDLKGLYR